MMAFPYRLAISLLSTAVLSTWTALAGPSRAQNFEFGPLLEELQLSPQQRRQLRDIKSEYSAQLLEHNRMLQEQRTELIRMLVGTETEASIRNQHERVATLSDRLAELSFEGMLKVRTVLTPVQREQFLELMLERNRQATAAREGAR